MSTTESIESLIESIVVHLQKLEGAPAVAILLVGCIIFGYLLKVIPMFPNNAIPMSVILSGAIVYPIMSDARNPMPLRVWMVRNVIIGLTIGFVAWMLHNKVLSRIEDRLGLFNKPKEPNETKPDPAPPAPAAQP